MANNRNLSALCDTSCISYNKDLHTLDAILGYLTNDYYATQIAVSIITRSWIIHVTDFWYPIRKSIISPTTRRFIRISALWPKTYSRRNCVKITCVVDKNTDISWIAQTSVFMHSKPSCLQTSGRHFTLSPFNKSWTRHCSVSKNIGV